MELPRVEPGNCRGLGRGAWATQRVWQSRRLRRATVRCATAWRGLLHAALPRSCLAAQPKPGNAAARSPLAQALHHGGEPVCLCGRHHRRPAPRRHHQRLAEGGPATRRSRAAVCAPCIWIAKSCEQHRAVASVQRHTSHLPNIATHPSLPPRPPPPYCLTCAPHPTRPPAPGERPSPPPEGLHHQGAHLVLGHIGKARPQVHLAPPHQVWHLLKGHLRAQKGRQTSPGGLRRAAPRACKARDRTPRTATGGDGHS